MTDISIKLTADAQDAVKGVAKFRTEFAEMVRSIEKPIRQIDALQKTTESARAASKEFFAAKRTVDELKRAIKEAGQPVKSLDTDLARAERTLSAATRAFDRHKLAVMQQRTELRGAGIDTRNLAGEHARLQAEMAKQKSLGANDYALQRTQEQLGITRLRQLRVEMFTLRADYTRLTQVATLSARERVVAEIAYHAQLKKTRAEIQSLTGTEAEAAAGGKGGGVAALAGRAAGWLAIGYAAQRAVTGITNATDRVGTMRDRLKNATESQNEFEMSLKRIEQISSRTYTPMANNAELFISALRPLREAGFTLEQVADLTEAVNLGLVASNTTGQTAETVITNFNRAMQIGVLRGDNFNSVLTEAPEIANALAAGLGKSREELIAMAMAGELTTEVVIPALISQLGELGKATDDMRVTVQDGGVKVGDAFDKLIYSLDTAVGFSEKLADQLVSLSDGVSELADGDFSGITRIAEELFSSSTLLGQAVSLFGDGPREQLQSWLGITSAAAKKLEEQNEKVRIASSLAENEEKDQNMRRRIEALRSKAELEGIKFDEAERLKVIAEVYGTSVEEFIAREAARNAIAEENAAQHKAKMKKIKSEMLEDLRKNIVAQAAELDKANKLLDTARKKELAIEKEFQALVDDVRGGGKSQPSTYNDAQDSTIAARKALAAGDVEEAIKQARRGGEALKAMQAAGESSYGLAGMAEELKRIATAAAGLERSGAEQKVDEIKASLENLVKQGEALKTMSVDVSWDDQNEAVIREKMKALSEDLARQLQIPVTVLYDSINEAKKGDPKTPAGFADGGWTGPGSKYKPAGVVHADEYVHPKRIVQEPGALSFFEQVRRGGFQNTISRMRGYAEGGIVAANRFASVPIPKMDSALTQRFQQPQNIGTLNFNLPGGDNFSVDVAGTSSLDDLHRAALKFGRTRR